MNKISIKNKLCSRKFWAAIVNFVTQLMIAFNATDSETAKVTAVIMAGAGVIAYIVGEGMADAAGVRAMLDVTTETTTETTIEHEANVNFDDEYSTKFGT